MQRTALICNNFSGINRSSSVYSSSVITASDMQNVELFATEVNSGVGIRTSKGNVSVCSLIPEDENVINIFESIQKGVPHFFVHTENNSEGKIYLFSPSGGTLELKVSGLSLTSVSSATDVSQGWSDLWVFSNSEEILSIELGNFNDEGELEEVKMMELKDADERDVKGLGVVIFAGRLWIFDGQVLWYSVQENIYDFSTSNAEITTSAGYIEFVKNITAIYPYLGTLAVFHNNSSCLISRDEDDFSFYKTLDFPGGCASYNSVVFHGTELYFYDDTKKGVFSFKQVINGDRTLGNNIALDIQDELFKIKTSIIHSIKTLSVVTSDRNEVWFLIPDGNETNSLIIIYDYIRKCWVKRKSQKINCFATIGGVLYSAGKKIYEEYNSTSFDGEFIEAFYKCTPLNLGNENSIKILSFPPKVTLDMYYSNSFYIEYTKNYDSMSSKTRYVKAKSLKNSLYFDIGRWDLSYFPRKDISAIKSLPASFFRTLQITLLTKNPGDDFCIRNIEFGKIKVKTV